MIMPVSGWYEKLSNNASIVERAHTNSTLQIALSPPSLMYDFKGHTTLSRKTHARIDDQNFNQSIPHETAFTIVQLVKIQLTHHFKLKTSLCTAHNTRTSLITDSRQTPLTPSSLARCVSQIFLTSLLRLVTSRTTQANVLSASIVLLRYSAPTLLHGATLPLLNHY